MAVGGGRGLLPWALHVATEGSKHSAPLSRAGPHSLCRAAVGSPPASHPRRSPGSERHQGRPSLAGEDVVCRSGAGQFLGRAGMFENCPSGKGTNERGETEDDSPFLPPEWTVGGAVSPAAQPKPSRAADWGAASAAWRLTYRGRLGGNALAPTFCLSALPPPLLSSCHPGHQTSLRAESGLRLGCFRRLSYLPQSLCHRRMDLFP